MTRKSRKGFFLNTVILFAAMFITKGLGAVLKIPLANILGGEGMGYFTTAYSIFTPVLAFACSGIPTIVTRSAAQAVAAGKYRELARVKHCALMLSVCVGLAGTILIMASAFPFVCFIANSPDSLLSVLIIAPAVLFCSVTAVYRGYYEGLSDALPTAISQVTEAVVKAGAGIGLSYYVYLEGTNYFGSAEKALPYAAAAAILGVSVSELCGTIFMLIRSRRKSDSYSDYYEKMKWGEVLGFSKDIFVQALPVALGAAAANLVTLADLLTVSNCINLSVNIFGGITINGTVFGGVSDPGNFMYGSYAGMVMSVYMLAAGASGLVGRCALPRLSCAAVPENNSELASGLKLLFKGTAVLSAPVAVFLWVLSEPALRLLYPVRETEVLVSIMPLKILSAGSIFAGLSGAVCMVFHAFGDFKFPVKSALIGGAVKLVLNAAFIIIPSINISGAALSMLITNIVCLIYEVYVMRRKFGIKTSVARAAWKPVIAALLSGAALYYFYNGLSAVLPLAAVIIISGILGCISYMLILILIDSEDFTAVLGILKRSKCT